MLGEPTESENERWMMRVEKCSLWLRANVQKCSSPKWKMMQPGMNKWTSRTTHCPCTGWLKLPSSCRRRMSICVLQCIATSWVCTASSKISSPINSTMTDSIRRLNWVRLLALPTNMMCFWSMRHKRATIKIGTPSQRMNRMTSVRKQRKDTLHTSSSSRVQVNMESWKRIWRILLWCPSPAVSRRPGQQHSTFSTSTASQMWAQRLTPMEQRLLKGVVRMTKMATTAMTRPTGKTKCATIAKRKDTQLEPAETPRKRIVRRKAKRTTKRKSRVSIRLWNSRRSWNSNLPHWKIPLGTTLKNRPVTPTLKMRECKCSRLDSRCSSWKLMEEVIFSKGCCKEDNLASQ